VAYFYCPKKQGTEDRNNPETVFRSLVRQLAWSIDDLSIAPIIKEDTNKRNRQSYEGNELLADDCIELLTQLTISTITLQSSLTL